METKEELLEAKIEQEIIEDNLPIWEITMPRDSNGYVHEDSTEANSRESAAKIFKVRLPKNYQDRDAADLIDYIHEL